MMNVLKKLFCVINFVLMILVHFIVYVKSAIH